MEKIQGSGLSPWTLSSWRAGEQSFNLQALEVLSTVIKQLCTSLTTYKDSLSEIGETKQE